MTIIKELLLRVQCVMDIFFDPDTDVMSRTVKHILANPEDRKSYLQALHQLKVLKEEGKQGTVVVRLSNNEHLELTV